MVYRPPVRLTAPRLLVVRPERTFAAVIMMVLGTLLPALAIYAASTSPPADPKVYVLLVAAAVVIFAIALSGAHSWFVRRVEIAWFDDGAVVLTFRSWPRTHVVSLSRSDIRGVLVERSRNATSRTVILAAGRTLPLGGFLRGDQEGNARTIRAFFGLA